MGRSFRIKFGILIFLGLFLFSLLFFNFRENSIKTENLKTSNQEVEIPIASDYFNLLPITINGSSTGIGAHNWTWAVSQDWCSGSGLWGDPYIIENVSISNNSYNAIAIYNSNVYFIIRNCTLARQYGSITLAGIKLYNVNNSQIINNDFTGCESTGILLEKTCTNNTIKDNDLLEYGPYTTYYMRYGIYLKDRCNKNVIESNKLYGICRYYSLTHGAIHLENNCDFNKIQHNQVNESKHGIYIQTNCDNNILFNNSITNNGNGIALIDYCDGTIISNNSIYDNSNGISISDHSNNGQIYNNTVINNANTGIYLEKYCDNYTIDNNNVSYNTVGINAYGGAGSCNYLKISHNELHNNSDYGIQTMFSRYTKIWENKLFGCGFLIESPNNLVYFRDITVSSNNTVNGKPVYYSVEKKGLKSSDFPNAGQIILIDCNDTILTNFDFAFCSIGIYLYGVYNSLNNTISNVHSEGNDIGINVIRSHYSHISNITAIRNNYGVEVYLCNNASIDTCSFTENNYDGLLLSNCDYSNVTNCNATNNKNSGIYIPGCEESNFIGNNVSRNAYDGLWFNGGKRNFVYDNIATYNDRSGIHTWSSNSDYHVIENNTASYNKEHGIYIEYSSDYNTIINNSVFSNEMNGITLENACNNNNITENEIHSNAENGIYVYDNSDSNTISLNTISHNNENGIYIYDTSDSNKISNNTVYNNSANGIYLYSDCDNTNITGNIIENKNYGVHIYDCVNILLSQNEFTLCGVFLSGYSISEIKSHQIDDTNTVNQRKLYYYVDQKELTASSFSNAGQVILISCNDTIISNANVSYGSVGIMLFQCYNITLHEINSSNNQIYGIYLKESYNSTLVQNKINYNGQNGIYLESWCTFINITGNQIEYNLQNGIYLSNAGDKSTIERNNINHNGLNGIYIEWASEITISGNTIDRNSNDGILTFQTCNYLDVSGNSLSFNTGNGISYEMGSDNRLIGNQIKNNNENGIILLWVSYSNISDNDIQSNSLRGVYIAGGSNNQIWQNEFRTNGINALDNGNTNQWDNGSIGNYWDDYTGSDENGDGIGDEPYSIDGTAGSVDNYPIWNDSIDNIGDDDESDNEQEDNVIVMSLIAIVGIIIIGAVLAASYSIFKINNKKSINKNLKEPKLTEISAETAKTTETREIKQNQIDVKSGGKSSKLKYVPTTDIVDKFERTPSSSQIIEKIHKDIPKLQEYLKSEKSIEGFPEIQNLSVSYLDPEDLAKIEKINLPVEEKSVFLKELMSLSVEQRKRLIDDLLNQ